MLLAELDKSLAVGIGGLTMMLLKGCEEVVLSRSKHYENDSNQTETGSEAVSVTVSELVGAAFH